MLGRQDSSFTSTEQSDQPKPLPSTACVALKTLIFLILDILVGVLIYYFSGYGGMKTSSALVDSFYLSSATVSTTGFGDVVPTSYRSRMLTFGYIIFNALIMHYCVAPSFNRFMQYSEGRDMPRSRRIFWCAVYSFICLAIGILPFRMEKIEWADILYAIIVSFTSTGYGDFAFRTLWGRVVGSVWLLITYLLNYRLGCLVFEAGDDSFAKIEAAERRAYEREGAENRARELAEKVAEDAREQIEAAERRAYEREEAENRARELAEKSAYEREEAENRARELAEKVAEDAREQIEVAERRAYEREESERRAREVAERAAQNARKQVEKIAREQVEAKMAAHKARKEAEKAAQEACKDVVKSAYEQVKAERAAQDAWREAENSEREREKAEKAAQEARDERDKALKLATKSLGKLDDALKVVTNAMEVATKSRVKRDDALKAARDDQNKAEKLTHCALKVAEDALKMAKVDRAAVKDALAAQQLATARLESLVNSHATELENLARAHSTELEELRSKLRDAEDMMRYPESG